MGNICSAAGIAGIWTGAEHQVGKLIYIYPFGFPGSKADDRSIGDPVGEFIEFLYSQFLVNIISSGPFLMYKVADPLRPFKL